MLFLFFGIIRSLLKESILVESDGGESCEGSTEAGKYSEQNTNVRNDNNIQYCYKNHIIILQNLTISSLKWILKRLYLLRSLHGLHHSQTLK